MRKVRAREQEGIKDEVACLIRDHQRMSQEMVSLQAAQGEAVKQAKDWKQQWQQAMRHSKMLLAQLNGHHFTTQVCSTRLHFSGWLAGTFCKPRFWCIIVFQPL